MSDDKTYGFKMGDDDLPEPEEPPVEDLLLTSELPPQPYDRLRRRITVLGVLMPLLLAGLIVAGYLDIKRRVSQTENTGSMEVLNLSRDLESSFSSLSVRQAKLEEAMGKMVAEVEKKNAALKTGLQAELQKAVAEVKSLKKSLAELNQRLAGVEKKQRSEVDRLKGELKSLRAELKRIGGKSESADRKAAVRVSNLEKTLEEMQGYLGEFKTMQGQLADLAEAMRLSAVTTMEAKSRAVEAEQNLQKLRQELEQQLATKLDRRSLADELKAEAQRNQKRMALLTARLSDRIVTLEKKVSLLTTQVKRLRKSLRVPSRSSRKVQEQDIKE